MADMEEVKQRGDVCDVCNSCRMSGITLWDHVMGKKHRVVVAKCGFPESPLQTRRFQYFLDTYLSMEPLVGLEYVEELQKEGGYWYWCDLCQVGCERNWLFVHITGPGHIATYADKHHPEIPLPPGDWFSQKLQHCKDMQDVAVKIYQLHGRKTISEIADPTPEKMAKCSSDLWTMTPKRNSARNVNGDERQAAGFKGNTDFLDYLQTFQIESDKDALIIGEITQNCTQALLRYRQEQQETPRGAPAPDNKADKGSSVGHCGEVVLEGAAAPTDAMCQFFNSIKNMEEAKVVNVLQKIAATNPAFRGINVPSVIRYLQTTGRLKTS